MHRFSDFAPPGNLEGDKRRIRDLLGIEIQIHGVRFFPSKVSPGKECVQIQFREGDDKPLEVAFTTSGVVIKQLKEFNNQLPFLTVIKQRGNYYTLT